MIPVISTYVIPIETGLDYKKIREEILDKYEFDNMDEIDIIEPKIIITLHKKELKEK